MSSVPGFGRLRGAVDPAEAIVVVVRVGVLGLCALLSVLGEQEVPRTSLIVLAVMAIVMSIPVPVSSFSKARPIVEAAVAAAVIGGTSPLPEPLLPYLVVPPLAAGLLSGALASSLATLTSLLVLVAMRARTGDISSRTDVTLIAEWIGLGLATGLVGSWARSVATRESQNSSTYVAAHRLLTRLRDVARVLPTGLDEVTLAQQVLVAMRDDLGFDRGALYGRAEGGVLMPLAYAGTDHVDWVPAQDQGIWGKVWTTGQVVQQTGTFTDPGHGHSAVLALRLGDRRVGLIGVERDGGPWSARHLAKAQSLADDAALRIDTGQLFSEVRALATVEERRRLAREIHDGIAQEVAALGFVVDDLRARTQDQETREELGGLRGELTRIVSELRLSIFDLRSDVQPTSGLGAALTSYVRSVGTGSGLTVHLVLDESAYRLPIEAETELLRVAQEAITNARRHARARNLWVTCRVDPPRAFLRIADDGQGLGAPRNDSYGMEIMRERTARVGASFTVRQRVGGGTVVEVTLGPGGVTADPAARSEAAL
ncbi:MAG TPA: GAF domain-containing sensor histidine kinase [Candidatus Nanopelagicales bacterium]|nr:GAF domain-containing sensor histidine kinase [Candidatus Nanopelagicales bacterium]